MQNMKNTYVFKMKRAVQCLKQRGWIVQTGFLYGQDDQNIKCSFNQEQHFRGVVHEVPQK